MAGVLLQLCRRDWPTINFYYVRTQHPFYRSWYSIILPSCPDSLVVRPIKPMPMIRYRNDTADDDYLFNRKRFIFFVQTVWTSLYLFSSASSNVRFKVVFEFILKVYVIIRKQIIAIRHDYEQLKSSGPNKDCDSVLGFTSF